MGQMPLLGASVTLLLLINTIGATIIPRRELHLNSDRYSESFEARAAGDEYRLPQTAIPILYTITLTPDYNDFANFTGEVEIVVTAKTDGNNISLHYADMTIDSQTITALDDTELKLEEDSYDDTTNIYTLTLRNGTTFTPDAIYKIKINYTGYLRDDMAGFYRSSYTTADGEKRWLVTTQFEPTDARRAFPCFDEPGLKAFFNINIRRPTNMSSISNAALKNTIEASQDDDLVMDIFESTPRMSTYLVAFLVSDFANLTVKEDNRLYNMWAREDAITQAQYGLSITPAIIRFMEGFTNIPFGFDKLDQAAIPDFSAGAMENWALVTYRERLMLFENDTSTTSNKQSIATVIAHELSHQWFGDLVSPAWWDYLWLNEGFATYFEYFDTHVVENEWRLDQQFVLDAHQYALGADASNTTRPITTSVYSPAQISSIFDAIAYEKAGSIIRQAEHFLTYAVFVKGLQTYLSNMKYGSATPDNLFAALQEAADAAGIFQDSDLNVTSIMESWTTQAGYPLITASRTSEGDIHITQERFLLNGESEPEPKTTWLVPITYTKRSSINFSTTTPKVWLNESHYHMTESLNTDEWFIFNIQETAFYRVLYNEENYKLLTNYLNSENHKNIHVLNKAQLLDDSLNLARAGVLNYSIALDLTTYLERETDFIPWVSYFRALTFLNTRLTGTKDHENFKSYVLTLLNTMYESVGFNTSVTDDHPTKLIRNTVLTWACNFNSTVCLNSASNFFIQWINDTNGNNPISPDLRSVVYCSALINGGEDEWNFLWEQYQKTNVATDQVLILNALGCTTKPDLLNRYLNYSINPDSGIRLQDRQSVFSAVYSRAGGVDIALSFLENNFETIQQNDIFMNGIPRIVTGIASQMTTRDQREKLREFLEQHKDTLGTTVQSALETVDANLLWLEKYGGDISAWLAAWEASLSPSAASYLSFSPTMSIVIILSGYLITKY